MKERFLYSIPIHECPECVKQLCDGILFFDPFAIIVLHISKSVNNINDYTFENENIFINPKQYNTSWGGDFTRIHISNYKLVRNLYKLSYIIFFTSNMLVIKNPNEYIKNYEFGFNNCTYDNIENTEETWFSDIKKYENFKKILKRN